MATGSYRHDRIESGETPYSSRKTPIILRDGVFNKQKIAAHFKKEATSIDKKIAGLVYQKILEYE